MSDENLGPMPESKTKEPELVPGGPDAVSEEPGDNGLGRDLSPKDNPAVDDALADEVDQADGKSQEPESRSDSGSDSAPEDRESGTTTEPEPPA